MAIDNLEEYFEDKFRACDGKTEKMTNCENSVYDQNSMMDNVDFSCVTMAEADVVKCIKLLTYGKAPGVDGLAAEHYIHGLGSSLPLHISSILTLCLGHGIVPVHVPTWCFNPAIQDRESSTSRQQLPPCEATCDALQSARATHKNIAHVPITSTTSRPVWGCH